ncbi:MAG: ethanolamine ammonia-lyase subunit EutB [Bacteroidota bacterium]
MYKTQLGNHQYKFESLRELLAKASPFRSGDALAGICAINYEERIAAQITLSNVPLKNFLNETVIEYEKDDITRLIIDSHDATSFAPISHLTVGEFRDWLLSSEVTNKIIHQVKDGITPEMAAAVSKIMSLQDLILVSKKIEVVTQFRTTVGLKGHFSTRLQPNHPNDDNKGIMASILDGLLFGCGDAVIGINPVSNREEIVISILSMLEELRVKFDIPMQSCVLSHYSLTRNIANKAPVDLIFQSIAGTQKANESFGVYLNELEEAQQAILSHNRNKNSGQVFYFETGQGTALSSSANHFVDQQTCEARAYAVARKFNPFLVNSVVGFIGPEYLFNGKQITRAGLEDHFCGKLLGLPMGIDVCYTNHADCDQDDLENLCTLLAAADCNFMMAVPGSDDIMLQYQSTSYNDAAYVRKVFNRNQAPEFVTWLEKMGIQNQAGELASENARIKQLLNHLTK